MQWLKREQSCLPSHLTVQSCWVPCGSAPYHLLGSLVPSFLPFHCSAVLSHLVCGHPSTLRPSSSPRKGERGVKNKQCPFWDIWPRDCIQDSFCCPVGCSLVTWFHPEAREVGKCDLWWVAMCWAKNCGRTGEGWASDTKEKEGRMDNATCAFIAAWWARFEFRVLYLLSRGALCQNMAARRTSLFPGFPVSAPFCTGKGHVHKLVVTWPNFHGLSSYLTCKHWVVWLTLGKWAQGLFRQKRSHGLWVHLAPWVCIFSIPWGGMRLVEDNRAPQKGSVEGSTPLGQRLYYKGKY